MGDFNGDGIAEAVAISATVGNTVSGCSLGWAMDLHSLSFFSDVRLP